MQPAPITLAVSSTLAELNAALDTSSQPWFAVMQSGDKLIDEGFQALARELRFRDHVDLIYTDERARLVSGEVTEVLKPGWSPRLLLEGNYVGGIAAFRTETLRALGGFTDEAAPVYDVLKRLAVRRPKVVHLPVTAIDTSGSGVWGRWQHVTQTCDNGGVTIIIPTRDRIDLLQRCIETVESTTAYPSYEIVIVDNGSTDPATLAYLSATAHTVVRCPGPFNFSWLINAGAAVATNPYLLLLNNDTEIHQADWLSVLVSEMADPTIGMVGCRLVGVAGETQHEGIALGLAGLIAVNLDLGGYCGFDQVTRDVASVTAACVLVRRSAFDAVNGMDEELPVGFGDVDLCLRMASVGFRTLYTPFVTITHVGQASRAVNPHRADDWEFSARYPLHRSREADPFVNRRIERFNPLWTTSGEPFSGAGTPFMASTRA